MSGFTRMLVTGASGFIGRNLLPLLRAGWPSSRIVAAARDWPDGPVPEADAALPLDMLDAAGLAAMVRAEQPDLIIHLAAWSSVGASFDDPEGAWRINVDGARALAAAVMTHVPACVLIHASTAEVYGLGFRAGVPLDEDAAMVPANPYAASKAAADLVLGEMALRGLRVVRPRLFNQVGSGQTAAFVVPAFARQIARAEAGIQPPVLRVGALDRWRDFVDVRDGCAALAAIAARAHELPAGVAINIASGAPRRIGDVLESLCARARVSLTVREEAAQLRPTDVERVAGDASRAWALLGWAPVHVWDDTLDSVLADWRARVTADPSA